MASKRGGLGRGLGALLGKQAADFAQAQNKEAVQEISIDNVQPNRYQPRRTFDPEAMNDLADSIKIYGVLQPIIVRKLEGEAYELIAGERRLNASKVVGLEKIPAIVREYTDAQMSEISIIENVQRQDLSVVEEAQAYERLIKEFGYTQETLAAKIGRSRSHITNLLRLLRLTPKVRDWLAEGKLSMGQARPLLAIENEDLQINAAEMIMAEDLSVRKVEAFVKELRNSGLIAEKKSATEEEPPPFQDLLPEIKIEQPPKISAQAKFFLDAEKKLSELIGAQVKIVSDETGNKIQIPFDDENELSKIIGKLEKMNAPPPPAPPPVPVREKKKLTTKEEKLSALRKFSTSGVVM